MSDNVSANAVKQTVNHSNGTGHGLPSPLASEAPAATSQDLAQWQQVMQAYYKQQPQSQQAAFYPAAHPYAGFFAGQVRCCQLGKTPDTSQAERKTCMRSL